MRQCHQDDGGDNPAHVNITMISNAALSDQGAMVRLIRMIASDEQHLAHAEAFVKLGDDVLKGKLATYYMLQTAIKMAKQWKEGLHTFATERPAGEAGAGSGGVSGDAV